MTVQHMIETRHFSPQDIADKTHQIYESILRDPRSLDGGNFTCMHPDDLNRLFNLYDEMFWDGGARALLGDRPLGFRLSKRMTRSAGHAIRRQRRHYAGGPVWTAYEIAVSTTLLFQTFAEDHRPVAVCGIRCRNRLEALQRIIEHEMIHLIEMLIWSKSSCSAERFQSIANRFFGHTDHRHQLITPRERALSEYGITAGDRVSFRFDGQQHIGVVGRITKRATVLVEDQRGEQYSNGKRYAKYYVPVPMLDLVDE